MVLLGWPARDLRARHRLALARRSGSCASSKFDTTCQFALTQLYLPGVAVTAATRVSTGLRAAVGHSRSGTCPAGSPSASSTAPPPPHRRRLDKSEGLLGWAPPGASRAPRSSPGQGR